MGAEPYPYLVDAKPLLVLTPPASVPDINRKLPDDEAHITILLSFAIKNADHSWLTANHIMFFSVLLKHST